MAWRGICLVALLCLPVIACELELDLPRPIWIEADYNEEQRAALLDAIDEWNDMSQQCLGHPALTFEGFYDDPDGFDEENCGDGRSVIYRGAPRWIYDRINQTPSNHGPIESYVVLGYGMYSDVILFPNIMWEPEYYRRILLHELGHFLGLGHVPEDESAVMYWLDNEEQDGHLTATDVEAFCIEYDCEGCEYVRYKP